MAVVDTEYEQNPQMLEREESEELDHLRSLSVARVRVTAERERERESFGRSGKTLRDIYIQIWAYGFGL